MRLRAQRATSAVRRLNSRRLPNKQRTNITARRVGGNNDQQFGLFVRPPRGSGKSTLIADLEAAGLPVIIQKQIAHAETVVDQPPRQVWRAALHSIEHYEKPEGGGVESRQARHRRPLLVR